MEYVHNNCTLKQTRNRKPTIERKHIRKARLRREFESGHEMKIMIYRVFIPSYFAQNKINHWMFCQLVSEKP